MPTAASAASRSSPSTSDVDTAVATLRLADGALGVLTVARHDPLGYDIRAELFGSSDSISVGLGPRTPMRSVEPGVPPPAGPAWPRLPRSLRGGLRRRVRGIRRGRPRRRAQSMHGHAMASQALRDRGGRDPITPRAPTGAARRDPRLNEPARSAGERRCQRRLPVQNRETATGRHGRSPASARTLRDTSAIASSRSRARSGGGTA